MDDLPVACTLGPDDGAARMLRREALAEKGRPGRASSGAPCHGRSGSSDDVAPIAALFGAG